MTGTSDAESAGVSARTAFTPALRASSCGLACAESGPAARARYAVCSVMTSSSGRVVLRELLGQGEDHPEILTVPETGYLKGAVLGVLP